MKNFFVILLLLFGLQSCEVQRSKTVLSIGDLLQNSGYFDGKVVRVTGEVAEPFNFMGFKGFFLRDGSGEVVVLVKGGVLPNKHEKVLVKGTFREAVRFDDLRFTIIEARKIKSQP